MLIWSWCIFLLALSTDVVAFAPKFADFVKQSVGDWRGGQYSWSTDPSDVDRGFVPVAGGYNLQPWFITPPEPAEVAVEEVAGAAQGVRELRGDGGELCLSRADEGFVFFEDGSYVHAPTSLGEGLPFALPLEGGDGDDDDASSPSLPARTLGLTVCLAHGDESRRRLRLAVVGGELLGCDVCAEGKRGGPKGGAQAAEELLAGRLRVVADASAWAGGARAEVAKASAATPASPWLVSSARWERQFEAVVGGSALLPPLAGVSTFLPGGCWVVVAPATSSEEGTAAAESQAFTLSIGSLTLPDESAGDVTGGGGADSASFAGELKELSMTYGAGGSLQSVSLRRVFPE
jgi:hypothetical protein